MIIPSNDGFFGNGDPFAYEVFDADGNFNGPFTIEILGSDIYDSGTEVNNGSGAAGFSQGFDGLGSGPSTDDLTGTVQLHPDLFSNLIGIQTAAGTTIGSDGSGAIGLNEQVVQIRVDLVDPNAVPEPSTFVIWGFLGLIGVCLLYTSPSPRDKRQSRMPSSA